MFSLSKSFISKSLLKRFYSGNLTEKDILVRGKDGVVSSKDLFKGKKVALVGIPGAFTPVCTANHIPGYIKNIDALKKKGIDEVICVSVNDSFVMNAWGEKIGSEGKVTMIADPFAEFTKELGLDIDLTQAGLGVRSKRYSMVVDDGKVVKKFVEESPSELKVSTAENMIENL